MLTTNWPVHIYMGYKVSYFCRKYRTMKPRGRKSLETRIAERIARRNDDVFLRGDFEDLGGYDQVGRALRRLTVKGKLVRIGYGLYARAVPSALSGNTIAAKPLPALALEALERLNVETAPSSFARAYSTGSTTQVPTGRLIAVRGRISRKIGYNGKYASFERIPGSSTA